ncbi:S locus-related glycoprotein 1 binding pollen coat protein [Vigna unguiculata]|uniref:S locus-related glycoprotein 1 binding pollen coat protein n=1 Tax=Vigna unguiculata TaxID=3917 RepID=A0A4D6LB59_VIGUN|nr:S locus-related glycoprotein 1 binding pollen coat protein [Vigna unguiculata]
MKFITSVLLLLLVVSIDIENEGGMKMVEARRCDETLYTGSCHESQCQSDCTKKRGNLASGHCSPIEDCTCQYPC